MGDAPASPPRRPRPGAIVVPKRQPAPVVVEGWAAPTMSRSAPKSSPSAAEGWAMPSDGPCMPDDGAATFVDPEARDRAAAAAAALSPPTGRRASGEASGWATPFSMARRSSKKKEETSNLREAVDAFRARERALLAQIETQKAAFDAREAALRFQLSEAAAREVELRADVDAATRREAALAKRVGDLERAPPTTPTPRSPTPGTPASGDAYRGAKWGGATAGEDLAAARRVEEDPQRPRSLRDLESSFKPKRGEFQPKGNPFRAPGATPPRSPSDMRGLRPPRSPASPGASRVTRSPELTSSPKPRREVETRVSELIEKDKAREGDVQRMLAMVSALQSEMASLKHENDRRLDPSREDSKSTPPETEEGR